jgi:hypothetical protein
MTMKASLVPEAWYCFDDAILFGLGETGLGDIGKRERGKLRCLAPCTISWRLLLRQRCRSSRHLSRAQLTDILRWQVRDATGGLHFSPGGHLDGLKPATILESYASFIVHLHGFMLARYCMFFWSLWWEGDPYSHFYSQGSPETFDVSHSLLPYCNNASVRIHVAVQRCSIAPPPRIHRASLRHGHIARHLPIGVQKALTVNTYPDPTIPTFIRKNGELTRQS